MRQLSRQAAPPRILILTTMPVSTPLIRQRLCRTSMAWVLLALAAATGLGPASAEEQAPSVRWQSSLQDFAAADQLAMPAGKGVLFVGSSTIRMWSTLANDFQSLPVVINRGYGGSTLSDCSHMVQQLVTQYRPAQVLVYGGDNDLAEGQKPTQVRDSLVRFMESVRKELPDTRIGFISIKPSPSRQELLPAIHYANSMIADYLQTQKNADYIDVYNPMLGEEGQLRPELFLPDMLHMNAQGYALWQSVIAPYVLQPALNNKTTAGALLNTGTVNR